MTFFDSLLTARDAIDSWLVENPAKGPQHTRVFAAREELSRSMVAIESMGIDVALGRLETDAEALNDATTRLANVANSVDAAQNIVNDVGIVVPILQGVLAVV